MEIFDKNNSVLDNARARLVEADQRVSAVDATVVRGALLAFGQFALTCGAMVYDPLLASSAQAGTALINEAIGVMVGDGYDEDHPVVSAYRGHSRVRTAILVLSAPYAALAPSNLENPLFASVGVAGILALFGAFTFEYFALAHLTLLANSDRKRLAQELDSLEK